MAPKSKSTKRQDASVKPRNSANDTTSQMHQPLPNWPAFGTLLPAEDLLLHTIVEHQIVTIPQFWTTGLCKIYSNFLSTLPLTTTPGKPKRGEAVRVNDRFQVDDADFAEQLWSSTALKDLVGKPTIAGQALSDEEATQLWGGEVLGLNSNIRIYRYSKGQFFDQHYDESNNIMFPSASSSTPIPAKTTWTLLLYLSSPATGCKGGETVFFPDAPAKRAATPPPVIVELDVGMALLHRHGKDCLLHEGREVTEGEKWVIRSDLCVKR